MLKAIPLWVKAIVLFVAISALLVSFKSFIDDQREDAADAATAAQKLICEQEKATATQSAIEKKRKKDEIYSSPIDDDALFDILQSPEKQF